VWLAAGAAAVTAAAFWRLAGARAPADAETVWWAAWLTAASSCLGALPFFLAPARAAAGGAASEAALGVSNAAAAGMMVAAAASLAWEGATLALDARGGGGGLSGGAPAGGSRALLHAGDVAAGAAVGAVAVAAAKLFVGAWGGAEAVFDGLSAADARKAALLCLVMFVHSATEGVGIGVAHSDAALGRFVSLSLAVHNVPEGLATCVALVPRGTPPLDAALWALATSLSQPLAAVVAFSAVEAFRRLQPLGLGFAAGAMAAVSFAELLPEAAAALKGRGGAPATAAVAGAAALLMGALQAALR